MEGCCGHVDCFVGKKRNVHKKRKAKAAIVQHTAGIVQLTAGIVQHYSGHCTAYRGHCTAYSGHCTTLHRALHSTTVGIVQHTAGIVQHYSGHCAAALQEKPTVFCFKHFKSQNKILLYSSIQYFYSSKTYTLQHLPSSFLNHQI
jgi:hypothetical protein